MPKKTSSAEARMLDEAKLFIKKNGGVQASKKTRSGETPANRVRSIFFF
jgi:hypothetical protein